MIPSIFGLLIAIVGICLLLRSDPMTMLIMMMICSLFGGAAALYLPALGGSSVPPEQFAMLFAMARIALPGGGNLRLLKKAFQEHVYYFIFTAYGILSAFFLSRIFSGKMQIVPLRITHSLTYLFGTQPLTFSSQNISVSIYLLGSLLSAVISYVAMHAKNAPLRLVKTGVVIAWVHIYLGLSAAALKGTPYDDFIDFFRNATYSQTDQSIGNIVRLTGVFPEPSVYAGFGFGWFVFLFECWIRDILPRRTGLAAAAMGLVLLCTTSSTAYAALGIYAALLVVRFTLFPGGITFRKLLIIAAMAVAMVMVISVVFFALPHLATQSWTILTSMTVGKQSSSSGLQRAFWARIGLHAFVVSHGLGIGAGSFRSSTIITAMIGSVGVIGTCAFLAHLMRALQPLRRSTFAGAFEIKQFGEAATIGVVASWSAVGILIPAALLSPSCDPGSDFAIFAGAALALRGTRGRAVLGGGPYGTDLDVPIRSGDAVHGDHRLSDQARHLVSGLEGF